MITKILASLFALVLFAGVCLSATKPVTDDSIVDQVRIKLSGDPIAKGGALDVQCKDGVVTLTGVAENAKQRDRAGAVAKKVKGVKQVVNNLTLSERKSGK
ncbi:MAG TPA: BON domain-containing protein [Candidatus Sulfopaludibacter sp.]|jgi:osmotically-inducible protein OsmY|nr:BON domain-containing protein [Candidatus Sulfopaludibacter sp.]